MQVGPGLNQAGTLKPSLPWSNYSSNIFNQAKLNAIKYTNILFTRQTCLDRFLMSTDWQILTKHPPIAGQVGPYHMHKFIWRHVSF